MVRSLFGKSVAFGACALISAAFLSFPDNSIWDQCAHLLSDEVNTGAQIIAHLLLFAAAYRLRNWRPLLLDLAVTFFSTAVLQSAKHWIDAPWALRPSGTMDGFPSGHASATFALANLLSIYYPRGWPAWYGVATLVSWSRVQTDAHTLFQVAAGIGLGTLAAIGCWWWLLRPCRACAEQT